MPWLVQQRLSTLRYRHRRADNRVVHRFVRDSRPKDYYDHGLLAKLVSRLIFLFADRFALGGLAAINDLVATTTFYGTGYTYFSAHCDSALVPWVSHHP